MRIRTWIGAGMITLGAMIAAGCDDDVTAPASPVVGSIVLQLEADSLSVDQTTQLQVTVVSVDGDTLTEETVTFLSSDEDIITVSDTGLVTAEGSGTATVTAQVDNRSATVTIYVRRAASISVAPSDTTLIVDDTLRLTATVLDADGAPIADAVVRWIEEEDVVVARVPPFDERLSVEFIALGVGNEMITAETEGLTATVEVRVDPSEVGSVILSPDSLTIAVGDTARLTVVVRDTTGAVIADPHVVFLCGLDETEGICVIPGGNRILATIDATGLVTGGPSVGRDFVFARSGGVFSNLTFLTVE
jgi:uncharacterized protein YjdB